MKVNLIIGGEQKCGTTALHYFLDKHPQILASFEKEADFFTYPARYNRGNKFYHSFFKPNLINKIKGNEKYYLDSSPSYLSEFNPEETSKRIYKYNPNCKLIFCVRNPINRAYSAYQMYKRRYENPAERNMWFTRIKNRNYLQDQEIISRTDNDFKSFENYVTNEMKAIEENRIIETPILKRGKYYDNLIIFDKTFTPLVLSQEELENNFLETMNKIEKYLNIKNIDWKKFESTKIHKGEYNFEISSSTNDLLKEYYKKANIKLAQKYNAFQYND